MANEGDLSGTLAAPLAFSLSSGSERTPRSGLPCSELVIHSSKSTYFHDFTLMNSDIDKFIPNLDGTTNHCQT